MTADQPSGTPREQPQSGGTGDIGGGANGATNGEAKNGASQNGDGKDKSRILLDPKIAEELIEWCAEELAQRKKRWQIRESITKMLGQRPSFQTLEVLLSLARKKISERVGIPKPHNLALSAEFWASVVADKSNPISYRMKAQKEYQELLGIGASYGTLAGVDPAEEAGMIRMALGHMDELHSVEEVEDPDDPENQVPALEDGFARKEPGTYTPLHQQLLPPPKPGDDQYGVGEEYKGPNGHNGHNGNEEKI